MRVVDLPGRMGLIGALAGIPVYDWSDPETREYIRSMIFLPSDFEMKFDEMYIAQAINAVIAGERAHFLWRVEQLAANEACRAAAGQRIKNFAENLLGENWELSSR